MPWSVSTLAGTGERGFADGGAEDAQFNVPGGLATDTQGNIIVADEENHRIRMITPDRTVLTLAGSGEYGWADGDAQNARFDGPYDVATDAQGNIIVADILYRCIRVISQETPTATLLAVLACRHRRLGAHSATGMRQMPDELWMKVFALARGRRRYRVSTLPGQYGSTYGVEMDAQGNIIFSNASNGRIRMIAPDRTVSTLAGGGRWMRLKR